MKIMDIYEFTKDYNLIIIEKDGAFNYYIEKNGFGNLLFIFGLEQKLSINYFQDCYIMGFITNAEKKNFWGD